MNTTQYEKYPAYFEHNPDNSYTVRLRNWDGAFSTAYSIEEAQAEAKILLLDTINSLLADNEIIPPSAKPEQDDFIVELKLDISLKIVLLNTMKKNRFKKADLAKALRIQPQRLTTFLSLKKSTNLDFIAKAFQVIGKTLTFSI